MSKLEIFPWNDNFETGIPQIDEQHKRLINLLNLLATHLAYQADSLVLDNIFNELAEYALYHFKTEEAIWQRFLSNDSWELAHKKDHQTFVTEVLKLKAQETQKTFDEVIESVLSFLTHWLAFHIIDSDKRMAKTVLLLLKSDIPLSEAKRQSNQQMGGAMRILIETILTMYDTLSTRTLQLVREVTERQKAEEKLRLAANVFHHTLDAICITDAQFFIIEANPSFYAITALSEAEVAAQPLSLLDTGLLDQKQVNQFWNTLQTTGHWSGVVHSQLQTGNMETEWLTFSSVKNEADELSHYVAIFSNVTHLIQQQQSLEKMAHHDMLTGLPNRVLLWDRLKLAMAHTERTQTLLAICYLDLDGFKAVNDQFGHIAGDQLLQEIAQRFLNTVRSSDTVARLGGDEFAILMGDLSQHIDYYAILDRILAEVARPVYIKNQPVCVSASIGVTFFPVDNSDAELLLHHADQAMYQAKQQGKSRYCLYSMC